MSLTQLSFPKILICNILHNLLMSFPKLSREALFCNTFCLFLCITNYASVSTIMLVVCQQDKPRTTERKNGNFILFNGNLMLFAVFFSSHNVLMTFYECCINNSSGNNNLWGTKSGMHVIDGQFGNWFNWLYRVFYPNKTRSHFCERSNNEMFGRNFANNRAVWNRVKFNPFLIQ